METSYPVEPFYSSEIILIRKQASTEYFWHCFSLRYNNKKNANTNIISKHTGIQNCFYFHWLRWPNQYLSKTGFECLVFLFTHKLRQISLITAQHVNSCNVYVWSKHYFHMIIKYISKSCSNLLVFSWQQLNGHHSFILRDTPFVLTRERASMGGGAGVNRTWNKAYKKLN
jgi:hypothetical protein